MTPVWLGKDARFGAGTVVVSAGLAAVALLALVTAADAQSSLGIGAAEPSVGANGPFAGLLQWVNAKQQAFYRALAATLKAMREDGTQLWGLVGLSFAYGVFHAAGPGHGKAVISSYMIANEVALRRGVVLSFAAAIVQALTAIALMGTVFLVLRGTAISMTDATRFLERASFALISLFGLWLLWRKIRPFRRRHSARDDNHHHVDHDHHPGGHAPGGACTSCGHSHAPDPTQLSHERLDLRAAWSAIAAVGLRPCSGALIVLTFSFLNALWLGGIVSVFAMAFGTAITVCILATVAVTAKNWAVALAGGNSAARIHAGIEIAGALMILVLGLVLLTASLTT